jgi:subtilase family protein
MSCAAQRAHESVDADDVLVSISICQTLTAITPKEDGMGIFGGRNPSAPRITPRVVVKFAPGLRLSLSEAAEAEHAATHGDLWKVLGLKFPGVTLRPFFTALDAATLERLEGRAFAAGARPRLTSYFAIVVPHHADPAEVAKEVATWSHVELAYVQGGPVPPPVNQSDDPLSNRQGYLSAAPVGIDARFAWAYADGSGIGFVDLEQGWTLDHEDLPAPITVIGPSQQLSEWTGHGTAVLGIVAAVDNDKGMVGIAPQAKVRVVSQWFGSQFNTAEAIAAAIDEMQAGDVLLIETTAPPDAKLGWVPVEVQPLVFDLIKIATSIGITVLEPAGNNIIAKEDGTPVGIGSNLDTYTDSNGKFVLNRATPDFKESGAIMVGAASSGVPHERLDFSNFGSRVDCYAWGQNIATCGGDIPFDPSQPSPQKTYTLNFGGTSGATAIVAGAGVLLQSWAVKELGSVFDTLTLRALLSDSDLNTRSKSPCKDQVGVMPDLNRIMLQLILEKIPSRWDAIISILIGGVIYGGGGWRWTPGGGLTPVGPRVDRVPLRSLSADKRDVLVGLATLELAGLVSDSAMRQTVQRSSIALIRSATEKIAAEVEER